MHKEVQDLHLRSDDILDASPALTQATKGS